MDIPENIELQRVELEKRLKNSLQDIEDNSETLRGLKRLTSHPVKLSRRVSKKRRLKLGKLKQVNRCCEDLQQECKRILDKTEISIFESRRTSVSTDELEKEKDRLEQEYNEKLCGCLQEKLKVTYNMGDKEARLQESGDIIVHYLMRGEEPERAVLKLIHRVFDLVYDHTNRLNNLSWYELCCLMLNNEQTFRQFYKRLRENERALEYILYREPQLLLHQKTGDLVTRVLAESLPYSTLHQILRNIRDKNGRTCMFFADYWCNPFIELFRKNTVDLYNLLSICDANAQTALHVNTWSITNLLAAIYTPRQREAFIKFVSIMDNNGKTALQVAHHRMVRENLSSLIRQVENNEYVMRSEYGTKILIVYTTNDRPGAEEQAQTLYDAFKTRYEEEKITLEKNKTEDDLLQLLKEAANQTIFGQRPKLLITVLTSHGSIGTIHDCDGNPIKLSEIEAAMCSDALDGRPKMLITECCQIGNESAKKPAYAPTHDDFCAVMSCVFGEPSTRGVFLGKLAAQIQDSTWDTNIFKLVNTISAEMEREKHKQTPIIMSTLKANFCPISDQTFTPTLFPA